MQQPPCPAQPPAEAYAAAAVAAPAAYGEAWLRLALEASGAATWTIDYQRGVETFDVRACEIAGLDPLRRDWPAGSFCALLHPDDREAMQAAQAETLGAVGPGPIQQYRVRRPSGEVRVLRGAGIAQRDDSGRVTHFIGVSTDVTEARRNEEALLAADREKDAFLATLAHELRNPLAPLRNAGELLRHQCPSSPELNATLAMLERQVLQLTRLVADLLDVSHIARGRIELRRSVCRLTDVVQSAVESIEPLMREHRHELQIVITDPDVFVDVDPARLVQCVANLLRNAAKYTPAGGQVVLREFGSATQAGIEIADTGVGIAPEFLPRVFDLFVQQESMRDRARGGLGIGLALVKRIVTLHGGTVEAASRGPGQGATFTVRLPRASPQATQVDQPAAPGERAPRGT